MSGQTLRKKGRLLWGFLYGGAFLAALAVSAVLKVTVDPTGGKYAVQWDGSVGEIYTDLPCGTGEANKFDLYVPAGRSRDSYGLAVYLHPGGFTSGDKSGDAEMLKWLCAQGYVAAGINYTLRTGDHPEASVYSQSVEIRDSIPYVVAEAERLGFRLDRMAVGGGSAGHTLAMLYGYRDAKTAPLPVKLVFGAVGPSCFYLEDWINLGADPGRPVPLDPAADYSGMAELFSAMAGREITADMLRDGSYLEAVKDISAALWVSGDSAPSVHAYGAWDRVQPFSASRRLEAALTEHGVPHEYLVLPHSGHALQNDNGLYGQYMDKLTEYLDKYLG